MLGRLAQWANRAAPGAKRLLPKPLRRAMLMHVLGANRDFEAFGQLASRRFLEDEVLPWLRDTCPRILFVGTGSYTFHYEKLFRGDRAQYATIDRSPSAAVWGAAQHIVAPIQEIGRHRAAASFDCVVMNGVFGFGIDDPPSMRAAIAAVRHVLRPHGRMILGWNTDLHGDPLTLGVLEPHFIPDEQTPWGFRRTFDGELHVNDFYIARP